MKRIAICGNIASGKTTVQKILEEKGYKVLDTDEYQEKFLPSKIKRCMMRSKITMYLKTVNFPDIKLRSLFFQMNLQGF